MPGIAEEFYRRQDTAIITVSSTVPAAPTVTSQAKSNGIPEIGGSEGGFIGLVVGLGVIFIGSCIGVFFLLRNYKHGGRTVRGKSGEVGVEPAPSQEFPRRRGTLFGFRNHNPKHKGWVRAPGGEEDDDEWDANDTLGGGPYDPGRGGDPVKLERSSYSGSGLGRSAPHGEITVPNLEYHTPRATPERRKDDPSMSTLDLQAPGHRVPEDDPFQPPARSSSPVSMGEDSLAHYATYVDRLDMRNDGENPSRQMSLDSAETAVSFPGGTRFREDL